MTDGCTTIDEIDLGQHHLVLRGDQSIEHMPCEQISPLEHVFHLESSEAYRLMLCLQNLFKPIQME